MKQKPCSLQGGDIVVINKHPFNPVVEELGVVAFLTWKQKETTLFCNPQQKRHTVHVRKGGAHLLQRL